MILAKVVGTVWSTRKHSALTRYKLLLVRPYFAYNLTPDSGQLVAVDTVGAGIGEDVVICLGTPARRSLGDENLPVDAAVLGIVDRCQLQAQAFDSAARRPLQFAGGTPPQNMEWI
jgi:ethanolamine utilization protein EutN